MALIYIKETNGCRVRGVFDPQSHVVQRRIHPEASAYPSLLLTFWMASFYRVNYGL